MKEQRGDKKKRGNPNKVIEKEEKVYKLDNILAALIKAKQPIDKTAISKALGLKSRQALYQPHYQAVFDKYGIGHDVQGSKKASPDYLNKKLKEKDIELTKLNKRIEKLQLNLYDMDSYNQRLSEEINSLHRLLSRFRMKFFDQLVTFNNINNFTVPFDVFDIFDFEDEKNSESESNQTKSNVVPINKTTRTTWEDNKSTLYYNVKHLIDSLHHLRN